MAVYKRDIADINLETGNIHRTFLNHSIGLKDQQADHFGVRVFRDGEPVNLSGVSVQGVFMPPQGSPIAITSGNIVSGNVAEVVLPQACYNYDGQFCLAIKLVDATNSVTGTVRIVDGMVDNTHASGTVAPTSAVPTYQEVLSVYEQAIAAISTVNAMAGKMAVDITAGAEATSNNSFKDLGNRWMTFRRGYYSTPSAGSTSSYTDDVNYVYALVACAPGDVLHAHGYGDGTSKSAWAFLDSSLKILDKGGSGNYEGTTDPAPTSTAFALVNVKLASLGSGYYGWTGPEAIKDQIATLKDAVSEDGNIIYSRDLKSAINESGKTINFDGSAHSSTLDKISFSAKDGDIVYFTVYFTGNLSIQLYGYNGNTATKLMENPKSGVRYLIKITSTYDAFSLYIGAGTAQTIIFKIEGERSALSLVKEYYSKISGEYVDIDFAGGTHGGTLDKIHFISTAGQSIAFVPFFSVKPVALQIFGFRPNGSYDQLANYTPGNGIPKSFQTSYDYNEYGIYFQDSTAQHIRFIIADASSLSGSVGSISERTNNNISAFAYIQSNGTITQEKGENGASVITATNGIIVFALGDTTSFSSADIIAKFASYGAVSVGNGFRLTIPSGNSLCFDNENSSLEIVNSMLPMRSGRYVPLIICHYDGIAGGALFPKYILGEMAEYDTKFFASYTHNTPSNLGTAIEDYAEYFVDGVHTIEPFLFFTDPHLLPGNYAESQYKQNMEKAIGTIQNAYNRTPTSFVLCGGDWLTQDDTMIEAARKLGFVNGIMNSKFNAYYPMLGNHDTNYQGISEEGQSTGTGRLSQASLNTLWFNKFGHKAYYDFKGDNTRFYVFDSGLDSEQNMDAYRWGQVDWFAKKLLENDDPHSAIAIHIFAHPSDADISAGEFVGNPDVQALADNITKIAQAYNGRQSITLNGETYNFNAVTLTGKVSFLIAGHTHFDADLVHNDIPVIITTWATWTPNFDLCFVDYDNGKYKTARIGTGTNREIDIIV